MEPLERLDSWKAIASYLERDVRTVQRWEKELGLPVRRLQHQRQASVYALKSELDDWLATRQPVATAKRRHPFIPVLAVTLLLTVLAWFMSSNLPAPTSKIRLGVLPFENLSADPDEDFLAKGFTDEMATQLGALQPDRLGVLRVTAGNAPADLDFILEGSLRREDGRVRVNSRLLEGTSRTTVWSESFEQPVDNVLTVQRRLARGIAGEIRLVLTPETARELNAVRNVDPDAYEAYLRGLHAFGEFTSASHLEMNRQLERAVELDASFAEARAWLALSYAVLGFSGLTDAPEREYERARDQAERVLLGNPRLAEPFVVLSLVSLFHDWDWARAQHWSEQAIETNPRSAWVHWARGWLLTVLARHGEGIEAMRRARELDPMNPYMSTSLGEMFWFARRFDEAATEWSNAADRHPTYPRPHLLFFLMYENRGMYAKAIDSMERLHRLSGRTSDRSASLRRAYTHSDSRGYWEWKLLNQRDPGPRCGMHFVNIHARLGDSDKALECLGRMYENRDADIAFLQVHPVFDSIRGEPRFEAMVKRLAFPRP
jgi:TolB-like protein/tetratricopeptide (TPR) repeat protein